MAATIVRRRACRGHRLLPLNSTRKAPISYYVLLPEIPPDTPETNPVMRFDEVPRFNVISPNAIITGCAKLAIKYDMGMGEHNNKLKDPNETKDFETVFNPMEELSVPMNTAWKTAKHLSYVRSTEGYMKAFQRIHPQIERAKNERWISEPLYNAVKEVSANRHNLTDYQKSLVDMYLLEGRLNGIELVGDTKQRFVGTLKRLIDSKNHYRNKVMLATNLFSHTIEDTALIRSMPKSLVEQLAVEKLHPDKGPWKVSLQPQVYSQFMEYCDQRLLRWNLWQAYQNRASIKQDQVNLSNHMIIKDIRVCRKEVAHLLGYENFAEMSMETKMAGSVENVISMIESMKTKFKPVSQEDIARLEKFARSEGFPGPLELWDVPFWRRRERDHLYGLDWEKLSEYFPLQSVLDGLFSLCDKLFDIEIHDSTSGTAVWHPDVRYYKITDPKDGSTIAGFFIDPYARPDSKMGGTWMESGRERSELMNTFPVSYLNLSINPPRHGSPALLNLDQLNALFYEFGHGLQQMLTTVPYSEVSGQRNVQWDTLQVCSVLMTMILNNNHVLQRISSHYSTGEPLSDEQVQKITSARKHFSSYDMMKQLYFSAYDMEIYISNDHWHQAMLKVWKEFMPVAQTDEDNHPCSLTAIFSDQYPAAYYSFKWAEMIAADLYEAFEEVGFEDLDKTASVGKRFRDTYLAHGGGIPANEVFRQFRGRDPSQDALYNYYGLS